MDFIWRHYDGFAFKIFLEGYTLNVKKAVTMAGFFCLSFLITACGGGTAQTTEATNEMTGRITVITREEGSGTRGAFVEIFGVTDADGNDDITQTAEIGNGTSVILSSVESNAQAIAYISLGSLRDSVKALNVDGTKASAENVKNGSYKVSRPFLIATYGQPEKPEVIDFINFIFSQEGQAIVDARGYISPGNAGAFTSNGANGTVVLAGSTSVSPLMEYLQEAYNEINSNVRIEIQASGSSAGLTAAIDGLCDIGLSSRDIRDSEKEKGLIDQLICLDGLAVIVNSQNPLNEITSEQVREIFLGNESDWSFLK